MNAVRAGVSDDAGFGYLSRMQASWEAFRRPIFFVFGENDLTAREFEQWIRSDAERRGLFCSELSTIYFVPAADHTFSSREWRDALAARTIEWIKSRVEFHDQNWETLREGTD